MTLVIFCYLSLSVFLCGLLLTAWHRKRVPHQKSGFPRRFSLICVTAASAFLLHLGLLVSRDPSALALPGNLALAIGQTLKLLTPGYDSGIIHVGQQLPTFTRIWYSLYAPLLYLLVPLLTVDLLLSLFKNFQACRTLLLSRENLVFVFSCTGENALTLAESIREKYPRALIAFSGVSSRKQSPQKDFSDRASQLGALCFRKPISSVNWKMSLHRHHVTFFVFTEDPQQRTQEALFLRDCYGMDGDFSLCLLSTGLDSQMLFGASGEYRMQIRRIDPVRNLINRNLYKNGHQLFRHALDNSSSAKQICAVILGLGSHGSAMVKALAWACQMDGYDLTIHAFDRDPAAARIFSASCPELMDSRHNGVRCPGEAQYRIFLHTGMDVTGTDFLQALNGLEPVTYVLTALGSDARNLETAVAMRIRCLQLGWDPWIQAIIASSRETENLHKASDHRGESYRIQFIGDTKSLFSWNALFDSELEKVALARHRLWGDEKSFWDYDYNYQSSMAAAIHIRLRRICGIPGASLEASRITPQQKRNLEILEHRRWNAFMRSEGYLFSGSTDPASRNDLAKLHNDLVPFDRLSGPEQRKDFAGSL